MSLNYSTYSPDGVLVRIFYIDINADARVTLQQFGQSYNLHTCAALRPLVIQRKVKRRVQLFQTRRIHRSHQPVAIGRALKRCVMKDHHLIIATKPHINFKHISAMGNRKIECRHSTFGCQQRCTAMCQQQWLFVTGNNVQTIMIQL